MQLYILRYNRKATMFQTRRQSSGFVFFNKTTKYDVATKHVVIYMMALFFGVSTVMCVRVRCKGSTVSNLGKNGLV